ncbi:hypothetical protein [Kitasatospora sp. CB01950]|uniref:hypothetical protein n=1 Tax=Kitasatospora sp. CB01950 TaxID=1703930 RepID=UPI0009396D73|nr:hypothetical protein [Kitasatospora sp. CB01950]OKJ10447.1 hypothetical protein AMK19_16570 [Kitasatospora sp. CB01950]
MPEPESERELSDVFEWAVGEAVPDLGLLVAGATAEGSAIRRRRRVVLTGAVVGVAGLALVGGLLLRPGAPPTAAATPAAGSSTTPVPTPRATLPSDRVPMTGAAGMVVLGRLLGPDLTVMTWNSNAYPVSTDLHTYIVARVHDRVTNRISVIEIDLVAPDDGPSPTREGVDCAGHPTTEHCEIVQGVNGESGAAYSFRGDNQQTAYAAKLLRSQDGVQITLTATGMDGAEPGVSLNTLAKWAFDPNWQPYISRSQAESAAEQVKAFAAHGPADLPPSALTPGSGPAAQPSAGVTGGAPAGGAPAGGRTAP